jgi:hypothetical protein
MPVYAVYAKSKKTNYINTPSLTNATLQGEPKQRNSNGEFSDSR